MATPRKWDWSHGHVQRETGTESEHVSRTVVFRSSPTEEYRQSFICPRHIYERLGEGERERCRVFCEDLFKKMLFVGRIAGIPNVLQICLEEALRTYVENLYRGFVRLQIQAGNKKWLVPSTIQSNVLEE